MSSINLPAFIDDISNYLSGIKNLSNIYIKNLKITLVQFLDFINIHKFKNKYDSIDLMTLNDIRVLSNSDIYSFIYYLADSNYKVNSRVVKIEHLRTFFNYLYDIEHKVFRQPFKKLKTERKIEEKLPKYLSLEEGKKMLDIYANSDKPRDIRNNAIIHLFLNCGLRLSELVNLDIDDLNLGERRFLIFGKGSKERTGYLNDITLNALKKYLDYRKTLTNIRKKDENALFISEWNKRIGVSQVKNIVLKALNLAGIEDKKYSTHTLRHTCATLLYRNGTDIKVIQELLGHVQIDTTEIYTHTHKKQVMDAMLGHPMAHFMMDDALAYTA